jgi:putative Holliday junction resolvase
VVHGRLLGVDTGDERTGLAVCDEQGRIAVPLAIIERRGRTLDRVADEVAARAGEAEVAGIVVGLPLNMDGTEGEQARKARAFARRLAARTGLPLAFSDERLSSFSVEQALASRGERRRRPHADDLAAAAILQAYLDRAASVSGNSDCVQAR